MPRRKGGRLVYLSVLQHILNRESRSEVNIATITCVSIPTGALNNYAQIMVNCCHKTPPHSSTIYIYGIILDSPVDQNPPTACLWIIEEDTGKTCKRHTERPRPVAGFKPRTSAAAVTRKHWTLIIDQLCVVLTCTYGCAFIYFFNVLLNGFWVSTKRNSAVGLF